MDKTLESLNFYFRTLILISATVLVVAIGRINSTTDYLMEADFGLERINSSFRQMKGSIQAKATARYRQAFLGALRQSPPALTAALDRAAFIPKFIYVKRRTELLWDESRAFDVDMSDPLLLSLSQLTGWNQPIDSSFFESLGYYPEYSFTPENIREATKQLVDEVWRPLLDADDLVIELGPPFFGGDGSCQLKFSSEKWAQKRFPLFKWIPCTQLNLPVDVSTEVQALQLVISQSAWRGGEPLRSDIVDLLGMTLTRAKAELDIRKQSAAKGADSVDFGGPKMDATMALEAAPVLIIILLLMMNGPLQTLSRLTQREPTEGGFWFGQFLGFPRVVIFLPFVILPAAAVFISVVLIVEGNHLEGRLGVVKGVVGLVAGVITLVLAFILFAANVRAAESWQRRVIEAATVPTSRGQRR